MTTFILMALIGFDDTPQKTIQSFVDAFNAHDSAAMSRRVVGQKNANFPLGKEMPSMKIVIGQTKIAGDTATVEADIELGAHASGADKGHETIHLRRIGGDWQIVPVNPNTWEKTQARFIGTLAFFATDSSLMGLAKTAAKKSACISNVKQVSIGTMMYASDHNDTMPKDPARFKTSIMPYVKNEAVFHCPADTSGQISYFLEARIAGKSFSNVSQPASTAMVIEGTPKKTAFRHGGKATVGFMDGHVKALDAAQLLKARTIPLK